MLPVYFESFIPEYGDYRHNLRNDQIRLPLIRCEYGDMNVKYQMHLRLRELPTPSNPPKYPSITYYCYYYYLLVSLHIVKR